MKFGDRSATRPETKTEPDGSASYVCNHSREKVYTVKKVKRRPMTFDESAPTRFTLTEPQFANAVGLSVALIRELRRQGRVPHLRVNKRVLYTHQDVQAFLSAHRQMVAEVSL